MQVRRILVLLLAAGAVAPPVAMAGAVNLRMSYRDGAGHQRHATLTCDSDGPRATGYLRHRNATKLCARAYALEPFLSSPPDRDRACTEIYGGPDRARIRGNVRGAAVDRRFSRTDGCEIADWDTAQKLLPRPRGVS
jgi:hypothetical protein